MSSKGDKVAIGTGAAKRCPTCKGKGFVLISTKAGEDKRSRPCPSCKGRGTGGLVTK